MGGVKIATCEQPTDERFQERGLLREWGKKKKTVYTPQDSRHPNNLQIKWGKQWTDQLNISHKIKMDKNRMMRTDMKFCASIACGRFVSDCGRICGNN
jgi:hypothetical protein